jgi:hypothetical protein
MLNAGEVVVLDAELGLAEVPDEDMPGVSPLEATLTSCIPTGAEANEFLTHKLGAPLNGNDVAAMRSLSISTKHRSSSLSGYCISSSSDVLSKDVTGGMTSAVGMTAPCVSGVDGASRRTTASCNHKRAAMSLDEVPALTRKRRVQGTSAAVNQHGYERVHGSG